VSKREVKLKAYTFEMRTPRSDNGYLGITVIAKTVPGARQALLDWLDEPDPSRSDHRAVNWRCVQPTVRPVVAGLVL